MGSTDKFAFEFTVPTIMLSSSSSVSDSIKAVTDTFLYYHTLYNNTFLNAMVDTNKYTCLKYPGVTSQWVRLNIALQNESYDWGEMWTAIGQSFYGIYAYNAYCSTDGDASTLKVDIETIINLR